MATSSPSISTKPWSDYTSADYSIQQWHNACLIHQHSGPPTSKGQCKLPVKTPNGAVNKNGVHAAAAALGGARGGLNVAPGVKTEAAKALIKLYQSINEKPPPSLLTHSNVIDFIEHHGVKGMKWGRRNKRQPSVSRAKGKAKPKRPGAHSLSDEELRKTVSRMQLEQQYSALMHKRGSTNKGANFAKNLLRTSQGIAASAAKETAKNMLAKRMQSALEDAMSGRKKFKQGKLFK